MSRRRLVFAVLATSLLAAGITAAPAFAATTWTFTAAHRQQATSVVTIACSDTHRCVAVGTRYGSAASKASIDVVRRDSAAHLLAPMPSDAATGWNRASGLSDISCATPDHHCLAVGSYVGVQGYRLPLLETSDGSNTGFVPRGLHLLTQGVELDHIACGPVSDYCAASGAAVDGRPILVAAHAGQWTQVQVDVPAGDSLALRDVGCTDSGPCYALGALSDASGTVPALVTTTAAGGSKIQVLPSPGGAGNALDPGFLSCYSNGCVALSGYRLVGGPTKIATDTLANGHWTSGHIRLPSKIAANPPLLLGALSCNTTGSTCAAVGVYGRDDPELGDPWVGSIVLTRTSGTWRAATAPQAPGFERFAPQLNSVACTDDDTCAASGITAPDAHYSAGALVESFVGGSWTPRDLGVPAGAPADAVPLGGVIGCLDTYCVGSGYWQAGDGAAGDTTGGNAWVRTTDLGS